MVAEPPTHLTFALGPGSEVDGRFRILEKRGSGSMGVVFRAEDIWLGRAVAIKMIDAAYAGDESTSKYFHQEARALAQIRHENVVHVYSFGQHDNVFYFAMEYVDGEPLDTMIESHAARGETIELERAALILRAIARGLTAVHDRKLVHRDVKPGNIVIEKDTSRPVLVDFGLARRAKTSNPRMTTTAGTPSYMAPEQARDVDGTRTTASSDLYAFACTAFELLTGRPVFDGNDVYEILIKHLNEQPPPLSSLRPDLWSLDPVFKRALSKEPSQRQATCAAFQVEIDAALKNAGAAVPPPSSSSPSIRPTGAGAGAQSKRMPGLNAIRVFVLESDDGLARQITRAADRSLDVPAIERFTGVTDLVGAFERAPADIVVLDEEASTSPLTTVVNGIRKLGRGEAAEIIVLSRSWETGPSGLASLRVKELPKPINMQVLGSVLRSAGARRRPSSPGNPAGFPDPPAGGESGG
jgi:eukaryotic-like serine/threonine-protein kinase